MAVTIDLLEYSSNHAARTAWDNFVLTPKMTANNAPSGVASADTENDGTRKAFRAFERVNYSDYSDCWHGDSSAYPHWLKYQFPQKEIVTYYTVACRPYGDCITDWKLQGSNDDSNWTDLDTQSSQSFSTTNRKHGYSFSNTTAYTYYRILASAGSQGNYAIIGELELFAGPPVRTQAVSVMMANNVPSPLVASASNNYSGNEPYKAFGFDEYDEWSCWATSTGTTGWLKIDLGSGNGIAVNLYSVKASTRTQSGDDGAARAPKAWNFQGSNNDSDWTTLDTQSNITGWSNGEERYFSFSNSTTYRYYKIDVTENNGATILGIGKLRLNPAGIIVSSESTIKQEGSYSLKVEIPTTSSGHRIHSALSSVVDISAEAAVIFQVRSSRTGSNIKIGFMDSGGAITEVTPNITSANTWQQVVVDLSGISSANLDAICKVFLTVVNADSSNIFYLDNITAGDNPSSQYDDGTPSGGIVFGGQVVEVGTTNYQDGTPDGGIVFGGAEVSADEVHQVDGAASGGIVFGGSGTEQWQAIPNTTVAVKGGTYRISGALYALAETLTVSGLGSVAAIVDCGAAPSTAGLYRYDLISINAAGTITVTAGTEAATPVMPATPSSQVKLDHVLRYYGQTTIIQADIGKLWTAPVFTTLTAAVDDDELAWAETSTHIHLTCRDQYGALHAGAKTITAAITTGNGSISPASGSGSSSAFTFTYTRGGADPGDVSPLLTFSSPTGPFTTAFIKLLDASGDLMT